MKEKLASKYQSVLIKGPLNGVIVIGFCSYLSGPLTLQNLVQFGALVIKIERKPLGDPTRSFFSKSIFNSINYGQLSIAVDYKDKKDQKVIKRLLQLADIIIDNRSVPAKENDILLKEFLESKDRLQPAIYCSINGYPNEKINRLSGLDVTAQAATGMAYTNVYEKTIPLKVGFPVLDKVTALLASNYVLANLFFLSQLSSSHSKQLVFISASLIGSSIWLQSEQVLQAKEGNEYFRKGNQDNLAAPFSFYFAKNGMISIATVNEEQFKKLCDHVLKDSFFHQRYPTIEIRLKKKTQFEDELNQKLRQHPKEYWTKLCNQYGIPSSPVLNVTEAIQQHFIKQLIKSSSDGIPIVTHGTTNSLFGFIPPRTAPQIDQDRIILEKILEQNEKDNLQSIRCKL